MQVSSSFQRFRHHHFSRQTSIARHSPDSKFTTEIVKAHKKFMSYLNKTEQLIVKKHLIQNQDVSEKLKTHMATILRAIISALTHVKNDPLTDIYEKINLLTELAGDNLSEMSKRVLKKKRFSNFEHRKCQRQQDIQNLVNKESVLLDHRCEDHLKIFL